MFRRRIADAHGNLFGTTSSGGPDGGGTLFEIAKTALGYGSTPTTLVNFNGANGSDPESSLIADANGDLFGTTYIGGTNDYGTVFKIAKTAHGYASTPTTLVSFNGTDGAYPGVGEVGLIADAHGDLFGTTTYGGANSAAALSPAGTVFEITGSGFVTHKTPSCSVLESQDSFVFDRKLGENTSVHSNMHDETIGAKSEFAQLAELLTPSHQDAVNLAHDAIDHMDHTATLKGPTRSPFSGVMTVVSGFNGGRGECVRALFLLGRPVTLDSPDQIVIHREGRRYR